MASRAHIYSIQDDLEVKLAQSPLRITKNRKKLHIVTTQRSATAQKPTQDDERRDTTETFHSGISCTVFTVHGKDWEVRLILSPNEISAIVSNFNLIGFIDLLLKSEELQLKLQLDKKQPKEKKKVILQVSKMAATFLSSSGHLASSFRKKMNSVLEKWDAHNTACSGATDNVRETLYITLVSAIAAVVARDFMKEHEYENSDSEDEEEDEADSSNLTPSDGAGNLGDETDENIEKQFLEVKQCFQIKESLHSRARGPKKVYAIFEEEHLSQDWCALSTNEPKCADIERKLHYGLCHKVLYFSSTDWEVQLLQSLQQTFELFITFNIPGFADSLLMTKKWKKKLNLLMENKEKNGDTIKKVSSLAARFVYGTEEHRNKFMKKLEVSLLEKWKKYNSLCCSSAGKIGTTLFGTVLVLTAARLAKPFGKEQEGQDGDSGGASTVNEGKDGDTGVDGNVNDDKDGDIGDSTVNEGKEGDISGDSTANESKDGDTGRDGKVNECKEGDIGGRSTVNEGKDGDIGGDGNVNEGKDGDIGEDGNVNVGKDRDIGGDSTVNKGKEGDTGGDSTVKEDKDGDTDGHSTVKGKDGDNGGGNTVNELKDGDISGDSPVNGKDRDTGGDNTVIEFKDGHTGGGGNVNEDKDVDAGGGGNVNKDKDRDIGGGGNVNEDHGEGIGGGGIAEEGKGGYIGEGGGDSIDKEGKHGDIVENDGDSIDKVHKGGNIRPGDGDSIDNIGHRGAVGEHGGDLADDYNPGDRSNFTSAHDQPCDRNSKAGSFAFGARIFAAVAGIVAAAGSGIVAAAGSGIAAGAGIATADAGSVAAEADSVAVDAGSVAASTATNVSKPGAAAATSGALSATSVSAAASSVGAASVLGHVFSFISGALLGAAYTGYRALMKYAVDLFARARTWILSNWPLLIGCLAVLLGSCYFMGVAVFSAFLVVSAVILAAYFGHSALKKYGMDQSAKARKWLVSNWLILSGCFAVLLGVLVWFIRDKQE